MRQGIRTFFGHVLSNQRCFMTFEMIRWFNNLLWQSSWYATKNIFRFAHGKINSSGKKLFCDFPENRSDLNRSVAAKSETWHHWQLFLSVTTSRNKTSFLNCRNKTQIHKKVSPPICWHCSIHSSEILSWHNLQRIFILTQELASQTNIFINIEFTKRKLFAITLVSLPLAELGGMF